MAADNRTEKATPRRREEARKRGDVARSPDLSGSLVLLAGLCAIALYGVHAANALGACMHAMLAAIARPQMVLTARGLHTLLGIALQTALLTVAPIAGACLVAAILGGVAQVGGRPRPQALRVDFKRISPVHGAKNLFGPNVIFEALKAVAKVGVVAAVAAFSLVPNIVGLGAKVGMGPLAMGVISGKTALAVAERAGLAYFLIGLVDYAWRRRRNERGMRMSKQELREEERQHNVSAEVKQALRRRQLQAARARMMAAVPQADVVVTNPTHYAVALRYDGSKPAPEVLAKGQELIAAQIRRVAEENDVPVIPDPPLARALYSSTEIGQVIPAELYIAVARVLAFVYRVARRQPRATSGSAA